jgi:hypothetical protein
MEVEDAALALLGGAVALANSILLLEDGTDDSNHQDGVTAEDILSFINVAHRHLNQGTRKRRPKNCNLERARCAVEEEQFE